MQLLIAHGDAASRLALKLARGSHSTSLEVVQSGRGLNHSYCRRPKHPDARGRRLGSPRMRGLALPANCARTAKPALRTSSCSPVATIPGRGPRGRHMMTSCALPPRREDELQARINVGRRFAALRGIAYCRLRGLRRGARPCAGVVCARTRRPALARGKKVATASAARSARQVDTRRAVTAASDGREERLDALIADSWRRGGSQYDPAEHGGMTPSHHRVNSAVNSPIKVSGRENRKGPVSPCRSPSPMAPPGTRRRRDRARCGGGDRPATGESRPRGPRLAASEPDLTVVVDVAAPLHDGDRVDIVTLKGDGLTQSTCCATPPRTSWRRPFSVYLFRAPSTPSALPSRTTLTTTSSFSSRHRDRPQHAHREGDGQDREPEPAGDARRAAARRGAGRLRAGGRGPAFQGRAHRGPPRRGDHQRLHPGRGSWTSAPALTCPTPGASRPSS